MPTTICGRWYRPTRPFRPKRYKFRSPNRFLWVACVVAAARTSPIIMGRVTMSAPAAAAREMRVWVIDHTTYADSNAARFGWLLPSDTVPWLFR